MKIQQKIVVLKFLRLTQEIKITLPVPHIITYNGNYFHDLSIDPSASPPVDYERWLPSGVGGNARVVAYQGGILTCGGILAGVSHTGCYHFDPQRRENPVVFPSLSQGRNSFGLVAMGDGRIWAIGGRIVEDDIGIRSIFAVLHFYFIIVTRIQYTSTADLITK